MVSISADDRDRIALLEPLPHAARRWAGAVTAVLSTAGDPKTVSGWARSLGASASVLRTTCRAAGVGCKKSLDFARLLRAVHRAADTGWDPFNLLDVVDDRTMDRLLTRGGLTAWTCAAAPSLDAFIRNQRLVSRPDLLTAVEITIEAAVRRRPR